MTVVIRQARLSDRHAIDSFVVEAYDNLAPYKGAERWSWQFVANPFGDRSNSLAPVWIAGDDDRVVGQIAVQEAVLQIGEKIHDAGWIVDVMVLPSHRRQCLGHRLHRSVADVVPILVTLTMAPATRRISEKAGCITLGRVRQFTRWVRLDAKTVYRYLMYRTVHRPRMHALAHIGCRVFLFDRLFSRLVNPLLRIRDFLDTSRFTRRHMDILEVDTFGKDVELLWERTRREYPVIFPRDQRFLNWRFVDCPQLTYRRFVARRDGDTVGYVVLRRCDPVELPVGVIVDLYASRYDLSTIEDLVRHSLGFFRQGVAAVDCATSIPEFEAVFRKFGFFVTRTMHPTCVCHDATVRGHLEEMKDQWFFSKGDHDWDQIHLA